MCRMAMYKKSPKKQVKHSKKIITHKSNTYQHHSLLRLKTPMPKFENSHVTT